MDQVVNNFPKISFSWYDYILFTVILASSVVIGIYFGCFGNKQSTANEYLMGGKAMKVIPIGISLIASHTSSVTLLALPADVYRYGAAIWLGSISVIILCITTIYIYLPVFFNLQVISTYEYLERRFDRTTRLFASFLYTLSVFFYLPIVVYIPALAFSAASGVSVHHISPLVCGICIFYTTIGGVKAVVWTDTLQFTVTTGAMATMFILGVKSAGSLSSVWQKAVEGGRLDIFDFDPNPTKRESFWIVVIGLTIHWSAQISIHQSCVQKFLAVPTMKDSINFGYIVMKTASVLTGLVMYAKYSHCDPFTTKQVTRNDQLLPFYVLDVAQNIPGLAGVFIAGVFSAALSTLSAYLNCLSGTIYEDFVSKFMKKDISQKTVSNILKLIVIVAGVLCTVLVLLIEHLGGLLKLSISLNAVTLGPMMSLFTLGMIFPRVNSKGAFYGALGGLIFISCIAFPAKYYEAKGLIYYPPKPLYTDGCTNSTIANSTIIMSNMNSTISTPEISFIFRISHYYYAMLSVIVSIILAVIISYITNKNDPPVDKSLISPVVHFLLPKDVKSKNGAIYSSVEKQLNDF